LILLHEIKQENGVIDNMGECIIYQPIPQIPFIDRYLGCILGGALGDALGYAVEFDNMEVITARFGQNGIRSPQLDPITGKALISDDTQMSVFTIDGILTDVSNNKLNFPIPKQPIYA
jgi:hypothetical protein